MTPTISQLLPQGFGVRYPVQLARKDLMGGIQLVCWL